jgi:pantoate--beta-alanine ligase
MEHVKTILDLRKVIRESKLRGQKVGLVPTMGALHDGHISLIRAAKANCDLVVVSIFVNPTQFGPNEDLKTYPRPITEDVESCRKEGVDIVFSPEPEEMYPQKHHIQIKIDTLTNYLCGASRPGHFNGVLQVVNKLFQIVQPDVAFFGQKDIQQFVLVSRMVHEFNIPVEISMVKTIREADGLAMSSRNRYLSDDDRKLAPELYRSLANVHREITPLFVNDVVSASPNLLKNVLSNEQNRLSAKGLKIDYLEVVDCETLQPLSVIEVGRKYIIAIAVFVGNTRLIDNIIVEF